MLEWVAEANAMLNHVVWGPAGLTLLLGTGLWLTVRMEGLQFRRAGYCLRHTAGEAFCSRRTPRQDQGAITQFQSMCTALAGTLGTGNIVGVATAILSGGPGAVFWMWVMALLGMMTSFAENLLGVYYRRRSAKGEWIGGPMYYLRDGLGAKPGFRVLGRVLAGLFALFCVLASFGIGNMSQTNSIAGNLEAAFGVPPWVSGGVLAVLTGLILAGGLGRVAAVTEKLVPVMALFYLMGAAVILAVHFRAVPEALRAIFAGAFGLEAVGGGAAGYGMAQAVRWGLRRGAFSNEAGLGSAVMVNACADTDEPVQQGMWGIFEVFVDTMLVCTLTALVLLVTGAADPAAPLPASARVGQAFSQVFGTLGPKIIAIAILLFAYSTVLGWSHYGACAAEYLLGRWAVGPYRVLFVAMTAWGASMQMDLVWSLSDTFNGLMMLPNLVGVLALSKQAEQITRNYFDRQLRGRVLPPMRSAWE